MRNSIFILFLIILLLILCKFFIPNFSTLENLDNLYKCDSLGINVETGFPCPKPIPKLTNQQILDFSNLPNNEQASFHPKIGKLPAWYPILRGGAGINIVNIYHVDGWGFIYAIGDDGKTYTINKDGGNLQVNIGQGWIRFIRYNNGDFYAIGKQNIMYRFPKSEGINGWQAFNDPSQSNFQIINFEIYNGIIYGVGADFKIYYRSTGNSGASSPPADNLWKVYSPGDVTFITIKDNLIYGIGTDHQVYTYPITTPPQEEYPVCQFVSPPIGPPMGWDICANQGEMCNYHGKINSIVMRPKDKATAQDLDNVTGFEFPPGNPFNSPDPSILNRSFLCDYSTFGFGPSIKRNLIGAIDKRVCYINYSDSIQSKCKDGTIKSRYLLGPEAKNNTDAMATCNNQSQQGKFGGCGIKFKNEWKLLKDSGSVRYIQIYGNNIYGMGLDNHIWYYPRSGGKWKLLFGNDSSRQWHEFIIIDGFIYAIAGAVSSDSKRFGIWRRKIIL